MRVRTLALLAMVVAAAAFPAAASAGPKSNAAGAKLCQKDGWKTLMSSAGQHFVSEQECTGYAAASGALPVRESDGDNVADEQDNCPGVANPGQADADGDGQGDACDADRDGDGVANTTDNCVDKANTDQADRNNDGKGDVCAPFIEWTATFNPAFPDHWTARAHVSGLDPFEVFTIHYLAPDGSFKDVTFDQFTSAEGTYGYGFEAGWGFPCTWNVTDLSATARGGTIESNHVSEASLPGGGC